VWQQEKAATDALEHDLGTIKQQPASPLTTPYLPDVDDTYEVSTIANLHAQAVDVQDIRSLVPIILDPLSSHYTC
jgi:hypothetical protein